MHELQEDTGGTLQLGCSMLGALLLPTWLLLTALLLQFVPELRGVDWYDPVDGTSTFYAYGTVAQWVRGGAVSIVLLGVAFPIVAQVLYVVALGEAASVAYGQAEANRYEAAVGKAALPVPLIVRKRVKGGARAAAIPVQVVAATLSRRFGARLVDASLVFFTVAGAVLLGQLIATGSLRIPAHLAPMSWTLAFVATTSFYVTRWRAVHHSGQTVGKSLFGIQVVGRDGGRRTTRRLVLRTVVPDAAHVVLAAVGAMGLTSLVVPMVLGGPFGDRFDPPRLSIVVTGLAWMVSFVVVDLLAGLPAMIGDRSLYDRMGGTWVARSELVAGDAVPGLLLRRFAARAVDGAFVVGCFLLPLVIGVLSTAGFGAARTTLDLLALNLSWWVVAAPIAGLVAQGLHWMDLTVNGTTIGKRLFRLRVVDADTGAPGGWFQVVLIRELVYLGVGWTVLPFIVGWLDPEQRTLHDWIAGTRVVGTGTGLKG